MRHLQRDYVYTPVTRETSCAIRNACKPRARIVTWNFTPLLRFADFLKNDEARVFFFIFNLLPRDSAHGNANSDVLFAQIAIGAVSLPSVSVCARPEFDATSKFARDFAHLFTRP